MRKASSCWLSFQSMATHPSVELNVFPNEAHLRLAEFEGRQYLVTEYVDGGTLRDWVKQESVQKGLLEWIETDLTMDPHNFLRRRHVEIPGGIWISHICQVVSTYVLVHGVLFIFTCRAARSKQVGVKKTDVNPTHLIYEGRRFRRPS